jgi:oxygen-independent coproporphyrinogen-3 oxidase
MAGIYIHIPFCKQKCHYCNFFSLATGRYRDEFIAALLKEIRARQAYLEGEEIHTIYFGGGTPSLYPGKEINRLMDALAKNHPIDPGAEITLEANPDDVTPEWISGIKDTPVNRISLGVQSFFGEDLRYLNRVHDEGQATTAIDLLRQAGYDNLTIDLIYGIPGLTHERWEKNLRTFISLKVPHLSAYSLTVEPRTALHHLVRKGSMKAPDEQQGIEHFKLLLQLTRQHGYVHYEISNFSLPGHYSRHNSIYWLGGNYLGLGPSAHSYNGRSRQWNVSNLQAYLKSSDEPEKTMETEHLTTEQRYNEYVMTSLRTVWGCNSEHIGNVFGDKRKRLFLSVAERFETEGMIRQQGGIYFLTDKGKLFADGIASELFADTDD